MANPQEQANDAAAGRVTELLRRPLADDRRAADELFVLVYDQLRRIAQQRMKDERVGHTLDATALVHEAYVRLVGSGGDDWQGRAHFFAAAAEAMRRILIEYARARSAQKRGGDAQGRPPRRVPLGLADLVASDDPDRMLMLDDALSRLEKEDPDAARVVHLRFFAGLSGDETARLMGVSPSTVDREWAWARAWLFRELGGG
jgi:RNA polymerase sigma factor (TIGR02999 family)